MPKYKITIEFDTDRPLEFPHEAELLEAMQVQVESLEDGDISSAYKTRVYHGKVEELDSDPIQCEDCGGLNGGHYPGC